MKEGTHLMHRILKYGENSKNLKDLERIWGSLDAIKELYDRAEVTNREQTNCEENIGEVISKQNSIPLRYSDQEDRLIIDEGTNTSNTLGKKDPREVTEEERKNGNSDQESERTVSEEEAIEKHFCRGRD